jgi:hypothetical protein
LGGVESQPRHRRRLRSVALLNGQIGLGDGAQKLETSKNLGETGVI